MPAATPSHSDALAETRRNQAAAADPASAQAKPETATLDFTAPVTVKNPYGAGEVEVANVDATPASSGDEAPAGARGAPMSSLSVEPPAKPSAWRGNPPSRCSNASCTAP